jgi:hypothetical protein
MTNRERARANSSAIGSLFAIIFILTRPQAD